MSRKKSVNKISFKEIPAVEVELTEAELLNIAGGMSASGPILCTARRGTNCDPVAQYIHH